MLLILFALGCGAIGLFVEKAYIVGIIFLLVFMYILYNYLTIPRSISIDNNGIQCGEELFTWDKIEQVLFTVNSGKDYQDTQIRLSLNDSVYIIHTRYYANRLKLRNLVEAFCNEKDIKYTVKDRGLYSDKGKR